MSVYVKKVQFKLHESYPSPIRGGVCVCVCVCVCVLTVCCHGDVVVMKPPYEISETGWGEFEVVIKIFFADSTEKPVS